MGESATVLVTGASSGIGDAITRRLLDDGHTVYAGARRVERMADLVDRGAHVVALDVTDDASMTGVVDQIEAESPGGIDVLVNNAGYGSYGSVEEVPIEEGRRQFEVNLFGLARLTQLVLPGMRERGRGRILNVSSIGGNFGEPLGAWYHASKFAVEGFSDSLRQEVAPFGVHVVVVQPGSIRTEWGEVSLESAERYSGAGPYRRWVEGMRRLWSSADRFGAPPEVVADAVASAVTAKRPATRYPAPLSARLLIMGMHVLPDRALDTVNRRARRM